MTSIKRDRYGNILNLDFKIFLFRLKYIRVNKLGNRLPGDAEWSISILGKDLESVVSYIEKRVGHKIAILEYQDQLEVHACADPDFSHQLKEWIEKYNQEKALAEKKFDLRKHMTKSTVESDKSKPAGEIVLSAW